MAYVSVQWTQYRSYHESVGIVVISVGFCLCLASSDYRGRSSSSDDACCWAERRSVNILDLRCVVLSETVVVACHMMALDAPKLTVSPNFLVHCPDITKTLKESMIMRSRVVSDFSSGYGVSGIQPFFEHPAKSGSSQISSRIWRMPMQLQYVQLSMDKIMQLTCQVVYSHFWFMLSQPTRTKNIKSAAVP